MASSRFEQRFERHFERRGHQESNLGTSNMKRIGRYLGFGLVTRFGLITALWCAFSACVLAQSTIDIDIEKPPFEYSETEDNNRVSRMIAKLESSEIKLDDSSEHAYLRSILAALEIPASSQTLVFSKTSMQVRYISRRNPRAIYFNDDTYVGWVRGSDIMEISTNDPKLGAAFYVVDMSSQHASVQRAYYDCLGCHATSMTQGIPGHTVRSVLPSIDGSVSLQKKSFITDHTSPFSERWGGWYVTGRHGEMKHMGNAVLRGGILDTRRSGNLLSLRDEFNTLDYLSPYSDIVALMVLEHQSQTHNVMTRADFSVRKLLYDHFGHAERSKHAERSEQAERSKQAGKLRDKSQTQRDSSEALNDELSTQIDLIAQEVTESMLFCDEAPLTSEVKGSVVFAGQFTRRGPKDHQGRSLREFDMKTRMFKYPCSYLIYSPAFDSMTDPLRNRVIAQMVDVLQGYNNSAKYAHLTPAMRQDILEILGETKSAFKTLNSKSASRNQHGHQTVAAKRDD